MGITMRIRLPSHFQTRACEWMLACITAVWGGILLLPFDVFGTNPNFSAMAELGPQKVWGFLVVLAGSLHLLGLYWNGTKQKSPHLRAACSAIGVLVWFEVSLGFFASGLVTPNWGIFPVFTAFSIYNVVRAMMDARLADEHAKAGGVHGRREFSA